MKIGYLGTAAAEGMPAVWCNCEACLRAKKIGGKNIRTRSQMIINDDLLLDFPMDTYMHALKNNLDLSAVKIVLITHAHMDHCYPAEFSLHGAPYAHNMTSQTVAIYGNNNVIEKIKNQTRTETHPEIMQSVILNDIKPYDEIILPPYKILALPAKHTVGEDCLIYIVTQGDKSALIFNDSGILSQDIYYNIAKRNIKLDFVSFDCTYGYARHGEGRHMGLLDNVDELEKMQKAGILNKNARLFATHFSHNGNLLYDELEEKCKAFGLNAAYDGLTVTI